MRKLTSEEIARAAGGRLIRGGGMETATEVVIDSREAGSGKVCFAIKGQVHDAHTGRCKFGLPDSCDFR